MWEQIIHTALLGTDKLSFDDKLLPETLQQTLGSFPSDDKEGHFLKMAALVHFYQQSGKIPPRFTGTLPTVFEEETHVLAPPKLSALLQEIIEVHTYYRNHLLDLWFDKLIANDQLIQPAQLVSLVMLESALPQKFRPKILKVIGKKGLQILAYKTNIESWQTLPDELVWQEGKLSERRVFFNNLRQTNPQKAIELLQTTWTQESLGDKKAFLEVIEASFQPSDIAFLEDTYSEFQFTPKERKGQKECRAIIARLLLRDSNSAFFQQTQQSLLPYFETEKGKGLLSLAFGLKTISLKLPSSDDAFWNTETMLSSYGFEAAPDAAIFPTNALYWLACLIETLPFEFWTTHLAKNLEESLQYFLSEPFIVKIEKQNRAILKISLITNAQKFKNIALAEALLKVVDFNEQPSLLTILPASFCESYLIQQKQALNLAWLEACFGHSSTKWSIEFSHHILQEAFLESTTKNKYLPEHIGVLMTRYLHPAALSFLENLKTSPTQTNNYYYVSHWEKWFVNPLHRCIDLSTRIENFAHQD